MPLRKWYDIPHPLYTTFFFDHRGMSLCRYGSYVREMQSLICGPGLCQGRIFPQASTSTVSGVLNQTPVGAVSSFQQNLGTTCTCLKVQNVQRPLSPSDGFKVWGCQPNQESPSEQLGTEQGQARTHKGNQTNFELFLPTHDKTAPTLGLKSLFRAAALGPGAFSKA